MSDKVKIPASAKTGAHSWAILRILAVALIPLTIWIIISIINLVQNPVKLPIFFAYPANALLGILFVTFALYHGSLGMKEVVEDYVQNKFSKHFFILFFHFLSIVTGSITVIAILRLHLIG